MSILGNTDGLPDPGWGGGQVTWSQVPEGLRRPSSPGRSEAAGKQRENREADPLANYLLTPAPSALPTVGDGGRGIAGRLLRGRGRGA